MDAGIRQHDDKFVFTFYITDTIRVEEIKR